LTIQHNDSLGTDVKSIMEVNDSLGTDVKYIVEVNENHEPH